MRKALIALFIFNLVLAGAVVWLITERSAPEVGEGTVGMPATAEVVETTIPTDSMMTSLPSDARIAYFFMDSIERNFDMVKDREDAFTAEGLALDKKIKSEMKRAQRRYEELVSKDRTYSTQAEIQADEAELQTMAEKIQTLQADSERQLAELELNMLQEITESITDFLSAYNEQQNLDFIYSIQPGGQIWVGNEGLDITNDVLRGLNAEYRASKGK